MPADDEIIINGRTFEQIDEQLKKKAQAIAESKAEYESESLK